MAAVSLPSSLVRLFPGAPRQVHVEATTVGEAIDRLDDRWPGMRHRLRDAGPSLRVFINVFVDGQRADLATPLGPSAELLIIASVAGG